jgi:transposase InsO family protein
MQRRLRIISFIDEETMADDDDVVARSQKNSRRMKSRYMIRDWDRIYGAVVTRRLRAIGIRDKPAAPASPWQNGFAERLIGSIRRECVDHIIILGEMHLRRVLKSYADYYNCVRTHRSLNKDAPVTPPVQRTGSIRSHAIFGGLLHHYARA